MVKGSRHKTVSRDLKRNISWIETQGAKVIIGASQCVRHKYAPGHLRITAKIDAGFKATGYTGNGVQKFCIYSDDGEVLKNIQERFIEE